MPRIAKYFLAVLLLGGTIPAVTAQTAEPPPLAAYGELPDVERMALSHSGTRLAAVRKIGGERVVHMTTAALDNIRLMRLGDAKVRSMDWIGDDYLIVVVSRTETLGPNFVQSQLETWHALILPADEAAEQAMVFDKDITMLNSVFGDYGFRQVDGKWLAYYAGLKRDRGARGYYLGNNGISLFAVDVATNSDREVASQASQGEATTWLLGADGSIAATFTIDVARGFWQVRSGGETLADGTASRGDAGLVTLGRDGTTLIYSELDEQEQRTLWYEVPLDGRGQAKLFAAAEEIDRLFTDRTTGYLIGLERTGSDTRPEFFDPAYQAAVNKIYKAFPGLELDIIDRSADFSKVLVRTNGNQDSGTWYVVDLKQTRAEAVGYERLAIEPQHVGPISTVEYTAQDGLKVSGILTLPPGREPKNLPLVMFPHGGPHAHDAEVFDWWAQAFASRGYAVFQPNFRGSTDRDEAFLRAGFGQWGKAMQTDISDGIAELAKRGIVDPERACIMGASYGGYAALAGVTLQRGLYRCAVAVAPVADLSTLFSDEYRPGSNAGMLRRSLLEELGPRSGFDEVSPRQHADRADAPILLIHGRDDTVVPFDQSEKMADALKAANKPYRMVVLREEDHWLSRAATRMQMLEEALAFVQQHNPAD